MSKTYIGAYNIINPNLTYNELVQVTNPMSGNLDLGSNQIKNVADPTDSQDVVTLNYLSQNTSSNIVENPLSSTLNANNYSIVNLPSLTIKDTVQNLTTYSLSLENGSVVCNDQSDTTSALMHIAINQGGTTKPYFTDFRGHPISNVGDIVILGGGVISGVNNSIQLNSPLDMNNNYIKDVQNIQFFNAPPIEVDLSNNLLYNDSIVVTASNINGYIAQANWEPTAGSDLNMGNHNINLSTGNINLNSGKLILNEFYSINTDSNNDLTFDENKVLVCQPKILQNLPFEDSTPGTSIGIDRLNPVSFLTNPISRNGNLSDPNFDIEILMTLQDAFTVNLDTAEVAIGLSNLQNPLNTTNIYQLYSYTGGFQQNDNVLSVKFRTDEVSTNLVKEDWITACNTLGVSNFYIYVLATAQSVENPSTNIINVQSCTVNFNVIDSSNQFSNQELVNINDNNSIQLYQSSLPVELVPNYSNEIIIFDYSQNTKLLSAPSFYVKCMVIASNLCIKFSTFIFDNTIVEASGSQNIIYKDDSFVSCGLYLNNNVLSVNIVTNTNLNIVSMCKCKTKIMTTF